MAPRLCNARLVIFLLLTAAFGSVESRALFDRSVETTCGPNEVFRYCATCEGTCDKPNVLCPRYCHDHSCHCDFYRGFVRDAMGHCIHRDDCRPNKPEICDLVSCPETQICDARVDLCENSVCDVVPKCVGLNEL